MNITVVLGSFGVAGWRLGGIQAISLSILVGTCVDYCIHLIEGYADARWQRIDAAASKPPIITPFFKITPTSFAPKHPDSWCKTRLESRIHLFILHVIYIRSGRTLRHDCCRVAARAVEPRRRHERRQSRVAAAVPAAHRRLPAWKYAGVAREACDDSRRRASAALGQCPFSPLPLFGFFFLSQI